VTPSVVASCVRFALVLLLSPSAFELPRRFPRRPRGAAGTTWVPRCRLKHETYRTPISPSSATPMEDLTSRQVRAPRTTPTGAARRANLI